MRLICPNCGAQYEVPTEVIPDSGRDVQCSDCGTTWFQHHPDHPPADEVQTEPEKALPEPQEAGSDTADHTWQDDTVDYGAEYDDVAPVAAETEIEPIEAHDETPPEPKRRTIDPAVSDVLREEAEREAQARDQEHRGTVETQQELGLQETDNDAQRRSEEARARMARLRGETEPQTTDATFDDIDPSSRSNLLPDIDEINSSLDSDGAKEDVRGAPVDQGATAPAGKSGFRSGFRLAVILAVLALLVYIFAPQLTNAVPQLAEPLSGYVDMVNSWRMGLNELMQNVASSLSDQGSTGS